MSTRAKSKSPGPERTEERRGLLRDARSRLRHELDEIRAAQGRLETGSFSVCEVPPSHSRAAAAGGGLGARLRDMPEPGRETVRRWAPSSMLSSPRRW